MSLGVGLMGSFFSRSDDKSLRESLTAELERSKIVLGRAKTVALDTIQASNEVYETARGVIERMEKLQNDGSSRPSP